MTAAAARNEVWSRAEGPIELPAYQGAPWWHALVVPPNREQKSADWLRENIGMHVYLPRFVKQSNRNHSNQRQAVFRAALPGLLFVPQEMMDVPRRDEAFDYARVRGFIRSSDGYPKTISKADIELVRLLEAKLNLPPEQKGHFCKVGQRVRFKDRSMFQGWIGGTIIEIADETRIVVEVPGLFGRTTPATIPASEIEAM